MCTPLRLTNQERELFHSLFNGNANFPEAGVHLYNTVSFWITGRKVTYPFDYYLKVSSIEEES